ACSTTTVSPLGLLRIPRVTRPGTPTGLSPSSDAALPRLITGQLVETRFRTERLSARFAFGAAAAPARGLISTTPAWASAIGTSSLALDRRTVSNGSGAAPRRLTAGG